MEFDYRWVKLLHLLGVLLFVGNILVTAVWKALADRTRDPAIVAFAQRLVGLTDIVFTGPGAGLVGASGVLLGTSYAAEHGGAFWKVGWIAWGLGLFALSGLIWVALLIPLQLRQAALARQFAVDGRIPPEYWRLGRIWAAAGVVATALPLVNLYLMVLRPLP
jgi:uncharacterized membrane protein